MPKDTTAIETTNADKVFDLPVKLQPGHVNTMSFSQDSISEMHLTPAKELQISFTDGSKVQIENFQELVSSAQSCGKDTIIQLSDNTIIYPEELNAQLAKGAINFGSTDSNGKQVQALNEPPAGQIVEKNIQPGHEYKMGFDMAHTVSAAQAGQNLILTFKDGGILVMKNYFSSMNSELPPAMTLADGSVIDANALLTSCKLVEQPSFAQTIADQTALAKTASIADAQPAAGDEASDGTAHAARKAGHAEKAPNVEPAAGDEAAANNVANVEPAAGTAGGLAGGRGGYGFASEPGGVSLNGLNALGAIAATQLAYTAPETRLGPVGPNTRSAAVVNTNPFGAASQVTVDESGNHAASNKVNFNFGSDGPSTTVPPVQATGVFAFGGSSGATLTSHGDEVTVTRAGNTYTGTAGGQTVFTLVVESDGTYTFTQTRALDHADATDANDNIILNFGVVGTDKDGDQALTSISVNVLDDAPVAVDDANTVGTNPITVTGNVLANDNAGFDGSATVTTISINGNTVTVPANGTISVAGTYGTLVIDHNGNYTYTSSNTALGTDDFTYGMKDYDGDQSSAHLSVTVTDLNTVPVIGNAENTVDETNLGPITVTGAVTANFFGDTPGAVTVTGANSFSSGGSKLGGNLTSGGVAVLVTQDGNVYTGKAGGVTVFSLTVNSDGSYSYTEFKPLDHADKSNPDDIITLNFGVTATDSDGDKASGTITINVKDDGPTAVADTAHVTAGQTTITGNVTTNDSFGQDGRPDHAVTKVIFNGQTYLLPVTHADVTITSVNGKLTINDTGAYSYTSTTTNGGVDTFTYVIQDKDGDTDTSPATNTLTITTDDIDYTPTVTSDVKTIDETNLGPNTVTGKITANYFGDGPGNLFGFTLKDSGSELGGKLSSGGVPLAFAATDNHIIATANGVKVFELSMDNNGNYTFTQFAPLDHADGKNPDDVITLNFGLTATDADGDKANGSITINIKDDAPVAHNDVNVYDTHNGGTNGNVVTGLNGGPGAADTLSHDVVNHVTKVAFGATSVNVPTTGTADIDGKYGTLHLKADGTYTYDLHANWQSQVGHDFAETHLFPSLAEGGPIASNSANLGIDAAAFDVSFNTTAKVTFVSEVSIYKNTLGAYTIGTDGTIQSVQFIVENVNAAAAGASSTVNINATPGQQSLGFFLIADGATVNHDYTGIDLSKGTLSFVYKDGTGDERLAKITDSGKDVSLIYTSNGVETVLQGPVYHTTERGASSDINFDGSVRVISGLVNDTDHSTLRIGFEDLPGLGDHDYNDTVFDISISASCPTDQFTYTLTDSDGDSSTATLDLNCNGNPDTNPTIGNAVNTVDETNLGPVMVAGAVSVDYRNDGPGAVSLTGANSFSSGGSKANNTLTSGGVAVLVTQDGNTYTGKAGGVTVFTLKVNADGSYSFTEFKPLDHADKANPDDVITLNFGVTATDTDGDKATGTITINVKDDGPTAVVDTGHVTAANPTITGNVTSNDSFGQDGRPDHAVTKVIFNGQTYELPATHANVTVTSANGTLTINDTGAYSYTATGNKGGVDTYSYVIQDKDGDTDTVPATSTLTVTVDNTNQIPTITNSTATVDETNMNPTTSVSGSVTANYFTDGPGSITLTGANSFSSGGSKANNTLTSGGVAVIVTQDGNVYTGKANGATVFTLTVNANGSYTYTEVKPLDHADKLNPDDVITLNFGVTATDKDGDKANGTITINVKDDGPTAVADVGHISNGQTTITGNVTSNDSFGQDGRPDHAVTKVIFNGQTYDLPATHANVTVTSANGTLTINDTGAYSYTSTTTIGGTDVYSYIIADKDGDTDTVATTATLTITTDDIDYTPTVTNATNSVDETNLGPITVTGAVTANYFGDGPGAVTLTGANSFSSGGSKANNALTSGGVAVIVTQEGNIYTGKAGGVTVFTLTVNANGSYSFTEFKPLDHADKTNPDDVITLNFGVTATDSDGDHANGTITISVRDDGPTAVADIGHVSNGQTTITGNVTSNDSFGQDGRPDHAVTKVVFNGQTYLLPTTHADVTITSVNGKLTINDTGAYSYTSTTTNGGTDVYSYVIADKDGDTDTTATTATLTITTDDIDYTPTVTSDEKTIDETNLNPTVSVSGSVTANYFGDGPGVITGNTLFSSSGSQAGGVLTSHGVAVLVSYADGVYTGKAGADTVFTLTLGTNGSYTFTEFKPLDHADKTNPDDIINLNFGVISTDNDGDHSTPGSIVIHVKDDGPTIGSSTATVQEASIATGATATGSVAVNFGHDGAGSVHIDNNFSATGSVLNNTLTSKGQAVTVTHTGDTYTGTAGGVDVFKFTSNADGTYNFNLFRELDHADNTNPHDVITLNFGVQATDYDGDTAHSNVAINVVDDGPTVVPTPSVVICVNDFIDNVYLPTKDYATVISITADGQGQGNQTLHLVLSGVASTWVFTPVHDNGNGTYTPLNQGVYDAAKGTWTYDLPAGQDFDGKFYFKPTSDTDLNHITFTATVSEGGLSSTQSDDFNIIVNGVDATAHSMAFASAQADVGTESMSSSHSSNSVSKLASTDPVHAADSGDSHMVAYGYTGVGDVIFDLPHQDYSIKDLAMPVAVTNDNMPISLNPIEASHDVTQTAINNFVYSTSTEHSVSNSAAVATASASASTAAQAIAVSAQEDLLHATTQQNHVA